ncbi:MAG: 1-acyl-sn-glycerol-3-phosphate acyltransferase [Candidatus Azobacteroides sp.]|nr:1-acyl-sn-glycerol-3-phosphate acyltransferase [Candidatus Azobacteroides sp.]
MHKLYIFIFKLVGWKYELSVEIPTKCVLCAAPHTSNWDYIIGMLFYKSIGGKPHVLMKKEWFFFPLGYLLKLVGALPVDRKKKTSVSDQMVALFRSRNHFQLAIAPEGTRGRNAQWKTGFYYIALNAGVPITLAYIDYSKKEIGIKKVFYPTGDVQCDIEEIKDYYKDVQAKHPERFAIK